MHSVALVKLLFAAQSFNQFFSTVYVDGLVALTAERERRAGNLCQPFFNVLDQSIYLMNAGHRPAVVIV